MKYKISESAAKAIIRKIVIEEKQCGCDEVNSLPKTEEKELSLRAGTDGAVFEEDTANESYKDGGRVDTFSDVNNLNTLPSPEELNLNENVNRIKSLIDKTK
jgi:hypothetical protein